MVAAIGLSSANFVVPMLNTLRGSTFTIPALYGELHTAIPGGGGTTATSTGSTERKPIVFSPPAGDILSITGDPPFWTNSGTPDEIISHLAFWSASTGGLFYFSLVLDDPIQWTTNDTIQLDGLTIPLTPVAAS